MDARLDRSISSERALEVPMTIDLSRVAADDVLADFAFTVTADDARDYLDATGEENDLWETHVPPLALGALVLAGLIARAGGLEGLVHTGQQISFHRAVAIDETLSGRFTVISHSKRKGVYINALKLEISSEHGPVADGRTTLLLAPQGATEPVDA